MKVIKESSTPILLWILLFMSLIFVSTIVSFYYGYAAITDQVLSISRPSDGMVNVRHVVNFLETLKEKALVFGMPLVVLCLLFWSLILRKVLWRSVKKRMPVMNAGQPQISKKKIVKTDTPAEKIVYRVDKHKEKRLYAHLLTVFQREGRLVDFFFEKLDAYEDDQIGAAVRNIHENCRKAMDRHLKLKPVVDIEEGNEMTVKEGFDSKSIRLVGDVKGEPPFKGIVRHRGWQITTLNIPDLTGDEHSGILEPAEIEIQ
jgi:hypothetical protein